MDDRRMHRRRDDESSEGQGAANDGQRGESVSTASGESFNPPMAAAARSSEASENRARSRSSDGATDMASSPSSGDQGSQKKKPDGSSSRKRRRESAVQDRGDHAEEPVLAALVDRLRLYFAQENPAAPGLNDVPINVRMARYLLEASSGNIDLAASLYCEEFLASEGAGEAGSPSRNQRPQQGADEGNDSDPGRVRPVQNNDESRSRERHSAAAARPRPPEEERRVRRRLEQQFEAMDVGGANEEGENDEEEQAEEVNAVPDAQVAEVAPEDGEDHGESVSISDDEAIEAVLPSVGNGWRMVDGVARHSDEDEAGIRAGPGGERRNQRTNRDAQDQVQGHVQDGERVRRFVSDDAHNEGGDVDETNSNEGSAADHDVDSFSDEEWLTEDDSTTARAPARLLWGSGSSGNNVARAGPGDGNSNVIDEDNSSTDSSIGIPKTWLNAGFTMSSCGTGLVVEHPPENELTRPQLRQQRNASRSTRAAPYHCGGVTAVLSAVTALMYSGASIQGAQVNCKADRKPFAELSKQERLREFDSRLADALSSLLLIAAKASIGRRKRALDRSKADADVKQEGQDCETMKNQTLQRRLRLCQTCRWDEDSVTSEGRPPEGEDAGKRVRISSSLSSVNDLRSYVLSNMRSFSGRGGVALFLETILRIHGKKCISSLVRRARKKLGQPNTFKSLVMCICEERWNAEPQALPTSISEGSAIDTTPLGHGCIGVEVLSLLLTGQVFSSLKGWSTDSLEVGLLTDDRGEVGKELARPGRNVWILRGETCYSTMWLDGEDKLVSNSSLDRPGSTFQLSHWNCWFGLRNRSGMRVNTARGKWVPPAQQKLSSEPSRQTVTEAILRRRREKKVYVVSSDELDPVDGVNDPVIFKKEIDAVRVHPEDSKFYPKEYRRWRFDLGTHAEGTDGATRDNWIPFFRLNTRQKLVVEMKLAPKINRILWTRWPKATMDAFTPEDSPPPVV